MVAIQRKPGTFRFCAFFTILFCKLPCAQMNVHLPAKDGRSEEGKPFSDHCRHSDIETQVVQSLRYGSVEEGSYTDRNVA